MTTATIRLSSKGQLVIPQFIRKALNLESGDLLTIGLSKKDQTILATPYKKVNFLDLAGSIRDDKKSYQQIWQEAEKESLKKYGAENR